jgi:ABC-type polysaccharide/polyol phosphate export permease
VSFVEPIAPLIPHGLAELADTSYNWLSRTWTNGTKTLLLAGAILASAALFIMPNSLLCGLQLNVMDYGRFHQCFMEPFVLLLAIIFRKNNVPWDLPCKVFFGIGAYYQNYR